MNYDSLKEFFSRKVLNLMEAFSASVATFPRNSSMFLHDMVSVHWPLPSPHFASFLNCHTSFMLFLDV